MALLTSTRPRAATRRNQRGVAAAERLAARRERQYLGQINEAPTPRQKLWQACRWLLAVCKGREDRTLRAVDAVVNLARDLSGEDYR